MSGGACQTAGLGNPEESEAHEMKLRHASKDDLRLLAELNRQLIQDEQAQNPMSLCELQERMSRWLASEYRAVIFEVASEPVAYALYRPSEEGLYLRQFFVIRDRRRQGLGRQAIELFRLQVLPSGTALVLEVLVNNEAGINFWRSLGFREHAITFRASS